MIFKEIIIIKKKCFTPSCNSARLLAQIVMIKTGFREMYQPLKLINYRVGLF